MLYNNNLIKRIARLIVENAEETTLKYYVLPKSAVIEMENILPPPPNSTLNTYDSLKVLVTTHPLFFQCYGISYCLDWESLNFGLITYNSQPLYINELLR